jgi:transposase
MGEMKRETDRKVLGVFRTLLGLPEPWRMLAVEIKEEEKLVEIEVEWPEAARVACPECQRACGIYDHQGMRWWRHLDTMGHTTRLCCRVPRSECPEHGVKTVTVPWAAAGSRFTMEFEAASVRLLLIAQSQSAAAEHLGLNWHQVHGIQAAAVGRGLQRRDTEQISRVGLDEKSFGRGHHYGTVLTDLDHRRVLEVVEHREQASAERALESLPAEQRARLKVVALDMWPAFMNAARSKAPNADQVHDRFHVMKHLNEAVDTVRKQEHAALSQESVDWLTGRKYLFLKSPSTWKAEEKAHFKELRGKDLKVTKAWGARESFQHFWSFDTRVGARSFFDQWHRAADATGLRPLQKVADMFLNHITGLLSYAVHKITNAVTEGFNSKIQMIKSAARGFRSFENYRIAILFHCGKLNLHPQ